MSELHKKHKINLQPVKEQHWWKDFEENLKNETPELIQYHPYNDVNDDEWKYSSGMREGYLLALSHFGVKL